MKPKKFNYYNVDAGHFPAQIKLCFSDDVFQEVLKDHKIPVKEHAFTIGMAETHNFSQTGGANLIVVAFNLEECDSADPSLLISTIAHESYHIACRVFDHIGEDEAGEESTAYLLDHIAKQLYAGIIVEKGKRANTGKRDRSPPKQAGKESGRTKLQVGQLGSGGSGSHTVFKPASIPSGTENSDGQTVNETRTGF